MSGFGLQQRFGAGERGGQRHAFAECLNEYGKYACGEDAAAVAVRQRRQRRAGGEGLCGRPALRPGVQPDWCGTHYAAAAFAVVVRRHAELRHRHQRGQAGHARRAAVM